MPGTSAPGQRPYRGPLRPPVIEVAVDHHRALRIARQDDLGVGAALGERLELFGDRLGAVVDTAEEVQPPAHASLQRNGCGGVLDGLGVDGVPAGQQITAQLLVGLVHHVTHAAVGGQPLGVALPRAGRAHPVVIGT